MDKQTQKLKKLVGKHLHQSKDELIKTWKKPLKNSDEEIWFFSIYRWIIFQEEVIFIFEADYVIDIAISKYIFGVHYKSIYFFENSTPEYRVQNFL